MAVTAPLFQPENSLNGHFCQGKKFSLFFKTKLYKNVDFSGQHSKYNKRPKPQMSHENNYSFCGNTYLWIRGTVCILPAVETTCKKQR